MTLRDIALKPTYDSDSDDILNDFYIPALSESSTYKRLAGFFSSSVLAVAARGIRGFIENGGHMELVCSAKLTAADVNAIREAREDATKLLAESALDDLASLEDEMVRDHVAALGWMVANDKLDVKVAFVLDKDGIPHDHDEIDRQGLFHQKVGIMGDAQGNVISFSGSDNESASAWVTHIEEFKVFRGWEPSENAFLGADVAKFDKFWQGRAIRTRVVDVPQALADKLIELAPADIRDIDLGRWTRRWTGQRTSVQLYSHQTEAVANWERAGQKGIFEMATGTGKTFAALECLRRSLAGGKGLVAVLSFPYSHLLRQWIDDLDEFGIAAPRVVVDSSNPDWKNELADRLMDIRIGNLRELIVLVTHDSLCSREFVNLVKEHAKLAMLVVDEVHGIGSAERRRGLLDAYSYRLGLSATPERWFDPEGSQVIREYFGDVVYRFTLREAITTINPRTGESFLTPYLYEPRIVDLTSSEIEQYVQLSEKISRVFFKAQTDPSMHETLELLLFKRQRILNNAHEKLRMLGTILSELGSVSQCLVYCSPQQLSAAQDILNDRGIIQHKFTMKEGVVPEAKYHGLTQRDYLLQELADGTIKALVAIKCLDEGVDVPPARIGILMASTSNPREFIQRRGRLLRRSPGKERAVIYDIIAAPPLAAVTTDEEVLRSEKAILRKETARFLEFAMDAWNSVECLNILHDFEARVGIS